MRSRHRSVVFDHHRRQRIGIPESVFCQGKSAVIVQDLVIRLKPHRRPVLFTRLTPPKFGALRKDVAADMDYDADSGTAILNGCYPARRRGFVSVLTGGTSDLPVAKEAARTLRYLGISCRIFADIGVAALWRLRCRLQAINRGRVVIVIAGMEAALASVVGGLTSRPVIAVPTSQGYGTAFRGRTALNGILTSCAPGITVVNIDNGYGAACAAARIFGIKK